MIAFKIYHRRSGHCVLKESPLRMIPPRKIVFWGKKKEKENSRFRAFLKSHADPDELDQRFKSLHEEIFAAYDCSKCRNCCKEYNASVPDNEIASDAEFLAMPADEFKTRYFSGQNQNGDWISRGLPCCFLNGNECILQDHKPESCKLFPYTNQPDRMGSLMNTMEIAQVCPIAYEIIERLKQEYQWTPYGR